MKQAEFERQHQQLWLALTTQLDLLERGRPLDEPSLDAFPSAYRQLCQHLALAESRGYSGQLIDQLHQLALRGHQQLYRHHSTLLGRLLGFITGGFARSVREQWRYLLAASLLFYGSLLAMAALVYAFPDLVYSILPPDQVAQMEQMYDPDASRLGRFAERGAGDDWLMFGYYVMNNIGIAFQTFASGLLFGLGTLFFLLFNGLTIGAVAGHLSGIGYHLPFWSFVIGHGAFELTAITLAGAAGLQLGVALLAPGRMTRGDALRQSARQAIRLVGGAIVFLLIAAFVEAYWSSMTLSSPTIKFIVGALLWLLVAAYFSFAGRSRHAAD